ncbi:MAG: hypothetical protein CVU97_01855 [Firmicutes bacterium HGW-Firmicutes-21]|nr:MAG: hypothetical protein CVU97_01855 [Firmicutes bacterium HGW-Firmicutes-21]
MKKQLYIVGGVMLAALFLFGVYLVFIKDDELVIEPDPFYTLTDTVIAEMEKIEDDVTITFSGESESRIKSDDYLNRAYLFALSYTEINKKISVEFDRSVDFHGIIIKSEKSNEQRQISYDSLYKSLDNGTKYAFDGERLYTNAILSVCGRPELTGISLRALSGYDTDGDTVMAGRPFMYPRIERKDVQTITVVNEHGSYKVYRDSNNQFYFEGAKVVTYDAEMFANLIVNSTYVLATGKISEPMGMEVYGLDDEENATAVITVVTIDKVTHKIIIGNKTSDGRNYYAKYHTKDFIYLLPAAELEAALLGPVHSYLRANLVYGISSTEDLLKVDNIVLDYIKEGYTLKANIHARMFVSGNLSPFGKTDIVTMLTDRVSFSGTYTNWPESQTLGGFTSNDGKNVYLEAPLYIYGDEGNYTVSFGILKDEIYSANLPNKIYASISVDGETFTEIDISGLKLSQANKEIKKYSFEFQSDEPVKFLRVYFGIDKDKYIVLDELTVFVDGVDAQPYDGTIGGWKLTSPSEYIPSGYNFIYPNNEFSNSFVTSLATLMGERVVDFGITSKEGDPSTLISSKLEQYGLDNPALHASYEFNGVTTDIYFSDINENGKFYCYSVIWGIVGGEKLERCSDVIGEISVETAAWLGWDIVDFLDHSLLSMNIDTIDTLTLTFDGVDHVFNLYRNEGNRLERVTANGKEMDLQNFRYLYISIVKIRLKGEYSEGDRKPTEMLKVKITGPVKSTEIIFYRVTTSKAFYTIDGEGSYYILVDSINDIKNNVKLLLDGKPVPYR